MTMYDLFSLAAEFYFICSSLLALVTFSIKKVIPNKTNYYL